MSAIKYRKTARPPRRRLVPRVDNEIERSSAYVAALILWGAFIGAMGIVFVALLYNGGI